MLRVISGACWVLLAGVLLYLALGHPSSRLVRPVVERDVVAPKAPDPVRLDQPVPWEAPGWTVTHQVAANGVLVVEVQSEHLGDATGVASRIVALVGPRYSEVLLYVRLPGASVAARRVQWRARTGAFIELNLETENVPPVGGRR